MGVLIASSIAVAILFFVFLWKKRKRRNSLLGKFHENSPQFRLITAMKQLDEHVKSTDAPDEKMMSHLILMMLANFFDKDDKELRKKYHLNPYCYFEIYCYLEVMGSAYINSLLLNKKIPVESAKIILNYLKYPLETFKYVLDEDVHSYFTLRLLEYGPVPDIATSGDMLVQRISASADNRLFVFKDYKPSLDLVDNIQLPLLVKTFQACTLKGYFEALSRFIELKSKA